MTRTSEQITQDMAMGVTVLTIIDAGHTHPIGLDLTVENMHVTRWFTREQAGHVMRRLADALKETQPQDMLVGQE
jgi:hypothetical protein